ncbi:phage virion morphogenesis protein [Parasalinivibrio latis]|uniref:phage virion morphogenesis protein n=1 Tax=Parasalinivibrio latis TaxID=2952610 RepID=UPI0030DF5E6F
MPASLSIDVRHLDSLNRTLTRLAKVDAQEVMLALANLVESQTRTRLEQDKQDPDGEPWEAWSLPYGRTRHSNHSLLENEDHLIDSLVSWANDTEARTGSNLVYAASHQYGDDRRNLPERAYLGVNNDDLVALDSALSDWADSLVGRMR